MAMIRNTRWVFVILSLLLVFAAMPSYAQERVDEKKILQPTSLGSVTLKTNVIADVNNLVVLPSDKGQLVGLTVSIHNNSNVDFDFIDYWVHLYSKDGTKFSTTIADKNIEKIPAKTTKDIIFYSNIGSSVKITDLVVKIIVWDFTATSFTRVIGEVSVPSRYNQYTEAGNGKIVSSQDTRLSFLIDRATIGKSEKYYRPDIKVTVKNEGKLNIDLPAYQISIVTNEGLIYPLSSTMQGTTLSPLSEKEFQLTASIPIEVNESNWKLAISQPINEGKSYVPVALFDLPATKVESADDTGKFYSFSNSDGVYYIKLDSINRLPIEDRDIVVANFTIENNGTDSLKVPNITGKFVFDEVIETDASFNQNDKVIAIQPNQSISVQAIGSIPYTFDVSSIKFTLQQKDSAVGSDTTNIDLLQFTYTGPIDSIPTVAWDTGYKVEDVGYRSEVKIRNFRTYEGDSTNIIVAQITAQNNEKRITDMKKIAGYFEMQDGTIYPATIQNYEGKITPGGTSLIFAWATIPKTEQVEDMSLVIGEAITEQLSSGQSESTLIGYVTPNRFRLPSEKDEQSLLQNLDLHPYKFSIERIGSQVKLDSSQLIVDFDYSLEVDLLTKANLKDQKIIISIEDASRSGVFTKEFSINDALAQSSDDGSALRVGRHKAEMSWTDSVLVWDVQLLRDYTINVYHEIQPGYKKLIATQDIPWLVNRKLK